jgi:hypothetical protein
VESFCDKADGGSLHTKHLGQELMSEGQRVPTHPITGAQNPATAAGFDGMNRIASDSLKRLCKQRLSEPEQETANGRAGVERLA